MTQEKGIPYQRHKPSAALREFLDPLDPGSYFDCGLARLRGLDDALLAEAKSRGRQIGDDSFQLVATDMGVIYCRPSISFAIAARWSEVTIVRPHGDDPAVLAIAWPTHGELKFTVSKRLGGNIFRRWLQLRIKADRASRSAAQVEDPGGDRMSSPSDGSDESRSARGPVKATSNRRSISVGEQPIQGADRVAATVAEAAAVVVGGRGSDARRSTKNRLRSRDIAATDVAGSETWEVVSKVRAPRSKNTGVARQPAKVDRRQPPEDVRRKRQAKADRAKRRRGGSDSGSPNPGPKTRWFDLDPLNPSDPVPIYDLPPLPPAPGEDRSPTPSVGPALPQGAFASTDREAVAEQIDRAEVPHSEGVADRVRHDAPPVAEDAVLVGEEPALAVEDPVPADSESVGPAADTPMPPSQPVFPESPTVPRPPTLPKPLDGPQVDAPAAVTGDHEPAERPPLPSVLVLDPPPQRPSWIGSPGSLVAAMVLISTFVLIAAVAVGSYRRSTALTAEVDPAGPTIPIIDHQRFRPSAGGESGEPTASELGQPESARYSETTAPPSTVGSGSAPLTSVPEWPPEDGPQTCNSNYSGCVPDVGDVDCPADGDGPIYWPESAMVMGEDVYDLDTDGDGEICEPDQPRLVGGAIDGAAQASSSASGG